MTARKWEIIVARNSEEGLRASRMLSEREGIQIPQRDIYLLHRSEKFEGSRFTKVYFAPRCHVADSIRGVLELVDSLNTLRRTCLITRDFEGYYFINSQGGISGGSKTL